MSDAGPYRVQCTNVALGGISSASAAAAAASMADMIMQTCEWGAMGESFCRTTFAERQAFGCGAELELDNCTSRQQVDYFEAVVRVQELTV